VAARVRRKAALAVRVRALLVQLQVPEAVQPARAVQARARARAAARPVLVARARVLVAAQPALVVRQQVQV
jgi:hypothetical protein